jgi:hypothetical protein
LGSSFSFLDFSLAIFLFCRSCLDFSLASLALAFLIASNLGSDTEGGIKFRGSHYIVKLSLDLIDSKSR